MRRTLICIALVSVFFSNAQQVYKKGSIIDSIPVNGSENDHYALYLPMSFSPDSLSSIVFIFEPAGRGKIGIEPFIESAESYGHILVSSNNIRNGPYDRNFELANKWFTEVFSNFSIHKNQIYLAGFSGGSRLASAIAVLTDQIEGVIACGGGFSQNPAHTPYKPGFSYVGLCGNRDMNFMEMHGVRAYLNKLNITNTLITYEGEHRWPPSEQLLLAFDWLAVEAHKKDKKTQAAEWLANSYRKAVLQARQNSEKGWSLQTAEAYERIIQTYDPLFTVDSISTKLSQLKKSKKYKQAQKSLEAAFDKEKKLFAAFVERFNRDYQNTNKAGLSWWKRELTTVEGKSTMSDLEIDQMTDRIRSRVFVMAYERMQHAVPKPTIEQKAFCEAICKLAYPEQTN